MRPTQLFSSFCLAQAALAAPILLVAGSSAKAVFIRPAHQMAMAETAQVVIKHDNKHHPRPAHPSTTWKAEAASPLDADGPMTTADLMALSQLAGSTAGHVPPPKAVSATHSAKPVTTTTLSSNKGRVSVGTLVVPGSSRAKALMSNLFDPKAPRPYLVPGYYVSSQRADFFVVGIILAFVLVVVAVETWGPVSETVSRVFRRHTPIRLGEDNNTDLKVDEAQRGDYQDYEEDNEDEDDECDMAPFGASPRQKPCRGFMLPEKVDEKAGWV